MAVMAVDAQQALAGTFVVGEFVGFTDEEFPKLQVRTGDTYVERIEFRPYSPVTGEATMPDEIEKGTRITVKVKTESVTYQVRDKQTKAYTGNWSSFVKLTALAVSPAR